MKCAILITCLALSDGRAKQLHATIKSDCAVVLYTLIC